MRKRRFFAHSSNWESGFIYLDNTQSGHLKNVLRLRDGDEVCCFDESGKECLAVVGSADKGIVRLRILDVICQPAVLSKRVTLAQSIIKSNNMDLIIQKASELGAYRVVPFLSRYSVFKVDGDREEKKVLRWNKIAVEAVKQCKREDVPVVSDIIEFSQLFDSFSLYDKVILSDQYSEYLDFSGFFDSVNDVLVVVGPEGGFSEDEYSAMKSCANCVSGRFNGNILRAETAAVSVLSIIQYEWHKEYGR